MNKNSENHINYDKLENFVKKQNAIIKNNSCMCNKDLISLPKELIDSSIESVNEIKDNKKSNDNSYLNFFKKFNILNKQKNIVRINKSNDTVSSSKTYFPSKTDKSSRNKKSNKNNKKNILGKSINTLIIILSIVIFSILLISMNNESIKNELKIYIKKYNLFNEIVNFKNMIMTKYINIINVKSILE